MNTSILVSVFMIMTEWLFDCQRTLSTMCWHTIVSTMSWHLTTKQYNAAMLAEALCKLEGFVYARSEAIYWQHGHSTEREIIFT